MSRPSVRYLNAVLGQAPVLGPTDPSRLTNASTVVSRSGAVVEKADEYYVSVFRLEYTANASIPIWIPRMVTPSVDGITLENTVSISSLEGAALYRGRANFKLQIDLADRVLWPTQPTTSYAFIWDIQYVTSVLNVALQEAWAAMIVDGSALPAANAPFVSVDPTGLLSMTGYPYSLVNYPHGAGDAVRIYFNRECASILNGWRVYYRTDPARSDIPDPNGEDIELILAGDGLNWLPQPAGARTSLEPAAPTTTSLTVSQDTVTVFPSVTTIRLLSSLPCAGEFVPGPTASSTASILTDFRPDPTLIGQEVQIYNAAFGDARWLKLTGPSPITTFSLGLEYVDWQGRVRPLLLDGPGQDATVKLCFAPRCMVEGVTG